MLFRSGGVGSGSSAGGASAGVGSFRAFAPASVRRRAYPAPGAVLSRRPVPADGGCVTPVPGVPTGCSGRLSVPAAVAVRSGGMVAVTPHGAGGAGSGAATSCGAGGAVDGAGGARPAGGESVRGVLGTLPVSHKRSFSAAHVTRDLPSADAACVAVSPFGDTHVGPVQPPPARVPVRTRSVGRGASRHYAVARGRIVGVFDTWGEAKASADNFPGSLHRSFADRATAEMWVAAERVCGGNPATAVAAVATTPLSGSGDACRDQTALAEVMKEFGGSGDSILAVARAVGKLPSVGTGGAMGPPAEVAV